MKVRGDIEQVNLSTGEKLRRISGDGESRLEPVQARWNFQGVSDEEVLFRYKQRILQLQDHAIEGSEILRRMKR